MGNNFTLTPASGSASSASQVAEPGPQRMPVVSEEKLRQLFATTPLSGTPHYAAIRPKSKTGGASQQTYEVLFYPTPNQDLTLEYRYSITPDELTKENPHPHGGKQHAETVLQSCLAIAEEYKHNARGPQYAKWMERLAASIELDAASLRDTADDVWPLDEDIDDLKLTKQNLMKATGRFLGFGANAGSWTHEQTQLTEQAVRHGLRKFYHPNVLPGEKYRHEWSFLRPVSTLTVASGVYTYDLPEDFAIIDGPLIHQPNASVLYPSIEITSEHRIRRLLQSTVTTGRPELAAIRPKQTDDFSGTRYEILLWPSPDSSYSLTYKYQRNPSLLPADAALPLGGQPHAQTVLEACLSAGEELGVETAQKSKGLHTARFNECLMASVSHDRNANAPDSLGQQFDSSDVTRMDIYNNWRNCDLTPVTYNGVTY